MQIEPVKLVLGLVVAFGLGVGRVSIAAEDLSADAERLFALKIMPLLKDKCLGCHGADADDLKGDFSVQSLSQLTVGGESGEAGIVPGEPDQGTVMEAIRWAGLEMPPKENDRLDAKQIQWFADWVRGGSPWPDEATQKLYRDQEAAREITEDGRIIRTSGGTSDQWTMRRYQPDDLWAFMPVKAVAEVLPPDVTRDDAVDHFIDKRLNEASLPAAESAAARDLIRRATFDLIGLPPSPAEVAAFEESYDDDASLAWRSLIDRLLDSPRYGEHQARRWFDVTRYADTGGMSNDFERSNMWRYRDYVIRAFNEDKPYNEFIVEQLAGDELADRSVRDRTGGSDADVHQAQLDGDYTEQESQWIVATGFLRSGPWDNAMVSDEEARQMYLDDLVNITGQTFLSQTLRCCKCHDHKFDPIPTRDYYSIYAAFATTQMAERKVPFLPSESLDGFGRGKAHVQCMLDFAVAEKTKILDKQEAAARAWYDDHGLPYKSLNDRKDDPDDVKPPRHVGLDYIEQGQLKVREQDEWIWNRRLERYQPMAQSVFNSGVTKLAWNGARKLRIDRKKKDAGDGPQNHILLGGALTAIGDRVAPGVLSALALFDRGSSVESVSLTDTIDGRRLELAYWIADEENALTTRSIANRIWQSHFGNGIAANPNNFGGKGAKPSHPELLDFLASDFVDHGWSIKSLHRRVMLSNAYRRSTTPAAPEKSGDVDPANQLLSFYPRLRMTAEQLRDTLLSVTGELVQCDGGLPIMPEINMEVALQPRMIQFSLAPAYQPSPTPSIRNRRSVYAYQVRGQADPFTELFNQPNANESCEYREVAAVTPQVFTLLNSDIITDRSIAMANRLQTEFADKKTDGKVPDKIRRAFELTLLREPTPQELERLSKYVSDMTSYHETVTIEPTDYPTTITRSLVEEFTGQTFEYEEILPVFENYEADQKPGDVSAQTRAIADMCLLLFNANEFLYLN